MLFVTLVPFYCKKEKQNVYKLLHFVYYNKLNLDQIDVPRVLALLGVSTKNFEFCMKDRLIQQCLQFQNYFESI